MGKGVRKISFQFWIILLIAVVICFEPMRSTYAAIKGFNYENENLCRSIVLALQKSRKVEKASEKISKLVVDPALTFDQVTEAPAFSIYLYYKFIAKDAPPGLAKAAREKLAEALGDKTGEQLEKIDAAMTKVLNDPDAREDLENATKAFTKILPDAPSQMKYLFQQIIALPRTLYKIHKIVKESYSTQVFDENVYAFWGFHHLFKDKHFTMRTWKPTPVKNINPYQVVDMSPLDLAAVMKVAMEIEDPIAGYSAESGRGFRFLLPTLGRFMGKNEEQRNYAKEHRIAWCESPWCREEDRHADGFESMIEKITGTKPSRANPTVVSPVTSDENAALQHLYSRESTEWNASSVYVVMAAHAEGELKQFVMKLMQDEIKHLGVVGAADIYLLGHRPWNRLLQLIKKALSEFSEHKDARTEGQAFTKMPIMLFEVFITHIFTEYYTRKYLATLPLEGLIEIYETPSEQPELAAFKPTPERQAEIDRELQIGTEKRARLARWIEGQRPKALAQLEFAKKRNAEIEGLIDVGFNHFRGAEIPGSEDERGYLALINSFEISSFSSDETALLRETLRGRLRFYQIKNNRHILARREKEKSQASAQAP
ncbi:MAG: hypothetical protein JWQ35_2541 [Bacteriovoracaceae bacterium]|nr:hypothetical protein [Bacteriovoracaceae bacterium]